MALQAGETKTLEVARVAPFGFFLTDEKEDVLLHKNEATGSLEVGNQVEVFLYTDHQGRLAATMQRPKIKIGTYDWVEAVEMHRKYGVFVNIGIAKDVLVSRDDLPYSFDEWPKTGDRLFCTLKIDKKGRLFAEPASFEQFDAMSHPATDSDFNKNIEGVVYKLVEDGAHIYTDEGFIGFNHLNERRGTVRLGERVSGRIIMVKEDGRINVSLLERSHEVMDRDAEEIYSYLTSRGTAMPYWDKSPSDVIQARFNMSKAAFKRALGRLMKEGKVVQEDGWTHVKKTD